MTKIVFNYEENLFKSLIMNGHTNYKTSGFDIVCSGISTATLMSLNLIDKIQNHNYTLKQEQSKGYLEFIIDQYENENCHIINLVITNLIETLKDIEKKYPNNIQIKINKEEHHDKI